MIVSFVTRSWDSDRQGPVRYKGAVCHSKAKLDSKGDRNQRGLGEFF